MPAAATIFTATTTSYLHQYFLLHKPYNMLSQFIGGDPGLRMLSDLQYGFPDGIHAVGRLDYHSEGLLLLTTNPAVTRLLFDGPLPHARTYVVQAYKQINPETLRRLQEGVTFPVKGGILYTTTPCVVAHIARPAWLAPANHELRADIPQTWLRMTLTEGKYRQIRKMLRTVGHPCRRLIRTNIESLHLSGMHAGDIRPISEADFFKSLNIAHPSSF